MKGMNFLQVLIVQDMDVLPAGSVMSQKGTPVVEVAAYLGLTTAASLGSEIGRQTMSLQTYTQ